MLISSTPPSHAGSRLNLLRKVTVAEAEFTWNDGETSSVLPVASAPLAKAANGAVIDALLVVTNGIPALAVVVVQPLGRFGSEARSKFSSSVTVLIPTGNASEKVFCPRLLLTFIVSVASEPQAVFAGIV